jgi:hypothetical protein
MTLIWIDACSAEPITATWLLELTPACNLVQQAMKRQQANGMFRTPLCECV